MGSIIKTFSIDEKNRHLVERLEKEADEKGQTFSKVLTDKIISLFEEKESLELGLESEKEQWVDFMQKASIEVLKDISYKAKVIHILAEAYIKYASYEGDEKRQNHTFRNVRSAETYVRPH